MSFLTRLFGQTQTAQAAAEVVNLPAVAARQEGLTADPMPSTTDGAGVSIGQRPMAPNAQGGNYTPNRAAQILEAALAGTESALQEFWRLADYVFERELHTAALLNSLALAVAGLPHKAEPPKGDDTRRARKIADDVQSWMEPGTPLRLAAPGLISKGVSHGLGVASVRYKTQATKWQIAQVTQKPTHWFTFDRTDGATPLLRSATAGAPAQPIDMREALVFTPRRSDALQVKNSLAWVLCWAYVVKSITLADQSVFVEAYGHPLVIGRHPGGNYDPKTIATLRNAVAQVSGKSRAVLSKDVELEIHDIARSGTDIYEKLCRYLDELISKVIWGSTLTTDAGGSGSYALGKVHAEGKYDQVRAYAGQWAAALQQLSDTYVEINHGPDAPKPRIVVDVEEAEDLVAKSQIVKNLTDAGVVLDAKEIREAFGFRNPDEGAETIGGGGGAGPVGPAPTEPEPPTGKAMQGAAASALPCGCPTAHAQASSAGAQALDAIDQLALDMLSDYEPLDAAINRALTAAAASVANPEDLPAALARALASLDVSDLQAAFGTARTKAQLGGLAGGEA